MTRASPAVPKSIIFSRDLGVVFSAVFRDPSYIIQMNKLKAFKIRYEFIVALKPISAKIDENTFDIIYLPNNSSYGPRSGPGKNNVDRDWDRRDIVF